MNAPPEAHLFCPKITDDDLVNYEEPELDEEDISAQEKNARIKAFEGRQVAAYYLSLLLTITDESFAFWAKQWVDRTEKFLTKCDYCVRTWHKSRGPYIRKMRESVLFPLAGASAS